MFKWWTDYQLKKLELKLQAQNRPFELMAQAISAQSKFLEDWLGNFKTTDIPTSTIVRDADEYYAEQQRIRESGELDPGIQKSIHNAIKAGSFPELADIIGVK